MAEPSLRTAARDSPAGNVFTAPRRASGRADWPVLGAIAAGGALGALARAGLTSVFARQPPGFPWGVFTINASGCLLIGVLMVAVTDVRPGRRLLRPFLGTGVLGGYTTFSAYIVDIQHLVAAGAARAALAYLTATVLAALAAVHSGASLCRLAIRRTRRIRGNQ